MRNSVRHESVADPTTEQYRDALRHRLDQAVPHVLGGDRSSLGTMELLADLATTVLRAADYAQLWLVMTCVAGVMPTKDELVRGFRMLQLAEPGTEHLELLRACAGAASLNENFARTLTVVSDAMVVDVDFSSRHGHNTGVQRVVRETTKRWAPVHDFTLVAWTENGDVMRTLTPAENTRVLDWTSRRRLEHSEPSSEDHADLLVPWNCTIVLMEVSQHRVWERLSCLGEFSNNTVALIGYDAIPITSANYVTPDEAERFVRYLSVVKHADLVVGISSSSAEEFAGFTDSLAAQRLLGPSVTSVSLPTALATEDADLAALTPRAAGAEPLIVCVGTQEPRKNQLALLAASEILWAEGHSFEVVFIGGAAMPLAIPFDVELGRLQRLGRHVSVKRNVSDAILERAYRDAAFSVFVSTHEGYGLPIGESLAAGTPVIASRYGSMAEVADGGGCILVDPRDDAQVADAMRMLLTNQGELARLRQEASSRVMRSWDDYAVDLWAVMSSAEARA